MKHYFIVGIKGTAMSNLAVILKQMGDFVAGCDVAEEFITEPVLKQYGISVIAGFDPQILPSDTDCVVYSAAHHGTENPVVKAAQTKSIRVISQAALLGELMDGFAYKLAVSGCHGKTTTTSLLAYTLGRLGKKPSYLVGTPFFNGCPGGHFEARDYFVIEADEYGVNPPVDRTPKLLYLHPSHIICTNIDFDHPDVYNSLEETKEAFLRFFEGKKLYLCADDPVIASVIPKIRGSQLQTYGFSEKADMKVNHPRYSEVETSFDLSYKGKDLGAFSVQLFGEKNILNAAAVILLLTDLGFPAAEIRQAIAGFTAVKRRFELVYRHNSSFLFDDYGHHPAEIAATIAAARRRFPGRRVIILFQPHTFSRTLALKNEFVGSLSEADYALVAPIFASAREISGDFKITSSDLEEAAQLQGIKNVHACSSKEDLLQKLKDQWRAGDVIFTVGAGDIYKLKDAIISIISQAH